ncbi:nucleotidyltransferase domain-containing protein [Candidatus Woesearchaeota archaeon]|nr:nucleotidyltransferase domain-containing protein [Candidatus Woesearchaeota archaeon]
MVNNSKLRLTLLQQDIIHLFFRKAGLSLNQRQISKFLNVSAPAVMKALPLLEKAGFVKMDKSGERWAIALNRTTEIMQLKRAYNLRSVYESGLADFLEHQFAGATIILFGSYSRGEDIINSDIDIAVIGKDKQVDVSKYEKVLERKININFYTSKIHKHLKESLCNGIVLAGGIEL